jgi:hypothetical protein
MPYTNSAAQYGVGTVIAINTGSSGSPTWTTIGEVISVKQTGRKARTADVTNLQSGAAEFITTLVESGSFAIEGNRVAADAGQVALETAFASLATKQFKATLPKTPAQSTSCDSYAFSGVIEEFNALSELSTQAQIKFTASIKVSNTYTFTAGA